MNNQKEIKVAMAIDDYKLSNKEVWWKKCLDRKPEIERDYELIREETGPGVSKDTTMLYRFYKLKGSK